jgi:hypothetical protein
MEKKILQLILAAVFNISTLSAFGQAEIQIIHNAADPAAASVDVYLNGTLTLDDFAFRTATPFVTLPSGTLLNIGVAPGNSISVNDTLKNFPVVLMSGQRYVAVANGVLDPANFASNPNSTSTGFTLFIQDNIQNAGTSSGVDFIGVHGSSDAPTVDIIARNVATLINDASYSDITGYITVSPASYLLDVTPAAGSPIVATFTADLSSLGGGSAVVFASGFLNPSTNQNGPAFGLFAAMANGTVVAFPATSVARLQVIHNAADPAAANVDVFVNGALLLDNFLFRTATPFVDVPAGVLLNIGIASANSISVNDTIKNFPVTLTNGGEYIAVANGVLNPLIFDANPDGASTAFTLFLQDQMRATALTGTDVDIRVVHGATDAPTVDVLTGASILVDNASYNNITPYITVPAADYLLNITPGNNNSLIVASFSAPLSSLAGQAAVVLASGFLTPATNQNGAAFGLLAVLADGTAFLLDNLTGIEESTTASEINIFPNPATDFVNIPLPGNEKNVTIEIINAAGKVVRTEKPNTNSINIAVNEYSKGIYFIKIKSDNLNSTSKLIVE